MGAKLSKGQDKEASKRSNDDTSKTSAETENRTPTSHVATDASAPAVTQSDSGKKSGTLVSKNSKDDLTKNLSITDYSHFSHKLSIDDFDLLKVGYHKLWIIYYSLQLSYCMFYDSKH